jgi:hypothetical protein
MAHVSGADSWSKDRIQEEIRRREREIADIRSNIDEREEHYESTGYRDADPGWYSGLNQEIYELEEQIDYLTHLL